MGVSLTNQNSSLAEEIKSQGTQLKDLNEIISKQSKEI